MSTKWEVYKETYVGDAGATDPDEYHIATVEDTKHAALIAAAPELLAALQLCKSLVLGGEHFTISSRNIIDSAIAKATGGTP